MIGRRRRIEVACMIDVARTAETLHAHAIPEGVDLRPGDVVVVHGAPDRVAFGDQVRVAGRATVVRAGWLARRWTRLAGFFAVTQLIEVGFAPREAP